MEPYQYHVYVCNQQKPEGVPGCAARGSEKIIERLRQEIMKKGLGDSVQVTTCGSIGLCERGPNMIVYPEGVWYSGIAVEDIPEIVSEHFQAGRPVKRLVNTDIAALKTEIETNKQKMLAAFKARDEAGILPDDLMQSIRGFQISRVILTAVELDLFSAVGQGADVAKVARQLETDPGATERLLNALAAIKLLEKKNGVFSNTPISLRYLVEGAPDDSRASLMHSAQLWRRWSTLTECVRQGTPVTYQEMRERGDDWTTPFIAAMDKNARFRAPQLVRVVGADNLKRMLDVGGGSGAYSIAFARANENLQAEILDLPTVIPIAEKHIKDAGLADRVKTRPGDFRQDDLGEDFDLVLISAICHMNSSQENIKLLQKSYAALSPEGRVVIQDFILDQDKTSPPTAALFALNMLVGTRSGSTYSVTEYADWLQQVGFKDIKLTRLPGPTALMIGSRQ